ncbi:diguanylate cyclase [Rhizobium binxianense]
MQTRAAAASLWKASPATAAWLRAAIVALVVFLASLFGILTRPVGYLAVLWPANAILLGMMVRYPALTSWQGWVAAFIAYLAADLVTGGTLFVTFWLTAANMAGVGAGYLVFRRLPEEDRRLQRPLSIILLFLVCVASAVASAVVGSGAARLLFARNMLTGFGFWFTTELVNYVVVLPIIMTLPAMRDLRLLWLGGGERAEVLYNWIPAATLAASIALSIVLGGPGAFAYPVPALLWCALRYDLFTTALLTLFFSVVQMIALAEGVLPQTGDVLMASMSIRLAVALIALVPLAVASINVTKNELLARLRYAVNYDFLTNAMTRGAFMERGAALLQERSCARGGLLAVLMLDIDHFKSINDRHGHSSGDKVLKHFSAAVAGLLRKDDLLGRLGGEEFAVLLPKVTREDAVAIAERIRAAVETMEIVTDRGDRLKVTVSGGLIFHADPAHPCLDHLLSHADHALYRAKEEGRNRIVIFQ